jgi:hypothetical protein
MALTDTPQDTEHNGHTGLALITYDLRTGDCVFERSDGSTHRSLIARARGEALAKFLRVPFAVDDSVSHDPGAEDE